MSFVSELKRRNVFKVAAAYAIVGWLMIQIADTVFPILQIPDWAVAFVTMLILLGFPVALVLSWAYEVTPDGLARTASVPKDASITHRTGRQLNYAIIALLALAVAYMGVSHYVLEDRQAVATSAEERRSIAVLPLTNQSAGNENAEFFAAGVHDQLLTQLGKIGALKVISRTSVMEYAGTATNLREIGRELGVANILEGSVRQAGDMFAMTVTLINAETDGQLWTEAYSGELTVENIFAVQRDMAVAIAAALEATILPEEAARLDVVPTRNRQALDFYLTGNEFIQNPDDTTYAPRAVEMYQRAVEADPNFALAYAALARAHSRVYLYAVDQSPARLEMVREAIDRAFELIPDLPEAHLALGDYYYHGFRDYDRALEHYALAREGLSGFSGLYESLAFVYRRMGRFEESIESMARAIELDPRNVGLIFQQGFTHGWLRRYSEAEDYFDRVLRIAPGDAAANWRKALIPIFRDGDPSAASLAAASEQDVLQREHLGWLAAIFDNDYATAIAYLDAWDDDFMISQAEYIPLSLFYGQTYHHARQPERAAEHFQLAADQLAPVLDANPDDARVQLARAMISAGLGAEEDALREARRAMELLPRSLDFLIGSGIHAQAIIDVLSLTGNLDLVLAELDSYLGGAGWWSIEAIARHPNFRAIRDEPRFQALIREYERQ